MTVPPLDWCAPWLAPYRAAGEAVHGRWRQGLTVAAALNEALAARGPVLLAAGPLRFVAQAELPVGEAYEGFVHRTACVPTRDNLHDFFNGLVWLHWPQLKAGLNARQAAEIAREGVAGTRGEVRDAITLLDENGALLHAPAELISALQARDWQALFVRQRVLWQQARLWLVGHALLEKLAQPRKPITAHVALADAQGAPLGPIAKPFLPLPVLGVPGWWPANADPAFYQDPEVFRPFPPAGSLRSTGSARPCRS